MSALVSPLDRGRHSHLPGASDGTASRRAARFLRDELLSGAIPPGARIPQEAIARRLGMSRIPVREALRQLETEGLVVLTTHASARVPKLDADDFAEIYRIRESIEPLAAGEAASRISEDDVHHLADLLRVMDEAALEPGSWLDLDRRFHLAAYAPAPMPRLQRTIEAFWNTTQPYRRAFMTTLTREEREITRAEHLLLLDAFRRGDPVDAEAMTRTHIRRTRMRLAARPEVFGTTPPRVDPRSTSTRQRRRSETGGA